MNKILIIARDECQQVIAKIVSDFGDGNFKRGRCLIDSITRVPVGFAGKKLTVTEVQNRLKSYPELMVIFDPNPGNAAYRLQITYQFGFDDDVWGLRLAPEEMTWCFQTRECDLFITSPTGELLAVVCHEDQFQENERLMWCPIPVATDVRSL